MNTDGTVLPSAWPDTGAGLASGSAALSPAGWQRCGEALSPLLALEMGVLTGLTVKYPRLVIVFKLKSLILLFPWK